ncbi:MAG: hypothetical protein AMXMBFR33_14300 [Candidatus Xenobia bacterium]
MKIRYLGHSAVAVEHQDTTVVVDPFMTGGPWVKTVPADLQPTTILLTHGHEDHVGDAVALSKKHNAPVVAMFELANRLAELGAEVVHCGLGGRIKHAWGWSKLVPAWHSSSFHGKYMGTPAGVVFEVGGRVFYHAGDTCIFSDMKLIAELYKPEIMFLPIGGAFTMDVFEAVKAIEFVSPRFAIPIHYNTFEAINQDPEEFRREVESRFSTRVQVMEPLDSWEIPSPVTSSR